MRGKIETLYRYQLRPRKGLKFADSNSRHKRTKKNKSVLCRCVCILLSNSLKRGFLLKHWRSQLFWSQSFLHLTSQEWGWQIIQLSLHCLRLFAALQINGKWNVCWPGQMGEICRPTKCNFLGTSIQRRGGYRESEWGGAEARSERAAAGPLAGCNNAHKLRALLQHLDNEVGVLQGLTLGPRVDNHCRLKEDEEAK